MWKSSEENEDSKKCLGLRACILGETKSGNYKKVTKIYGSTEEDESYFNRVCFYKLLLASTLHLWR